MANGVAVLLDVVQQPKLLQFIQHRPAGLFARHTGKTAAVGIDHCRLTEDVNLLQAVALTHLKVVGVVGRRDLHGTGAKTGIDIVISEQRDLPPDQR